MALRDYYQEGGESSDHSGAKPDTKHSADDWALTYLTVARLQSISEAFDDDASGFVTVAEANQFTTSRPLDWNLTHWMAFWAVGWHQVRRHAVSLFLTYLAQSMARYVGKIQGLLAKMFALRLNVLPANRASVNKYLDTIYHGVTTLHSALNPCYINESLQEKFNSYVEAEETRLRGNLEAISYDIDAPNTLSLITGEGRIERVSLIVSAGLRDRSNQSRSSFYPSSIFCWSEISKS